MTVPTVEVRGLFKTYGQDHGAVAALRGIDLEVTDGEFVAVMGPSGCGKSTLLHIVGAMERPSRGEVRFRGQSLTDMDDRQLTSLRRDGIGLDVHLPAGQDLGRPEDLDDRLPACDAQGESGFAIADRHKKNDFLGRAQDQWDHD